MKSMALLIGVANLAARLEKHSMPEPMSGCRIWIGATMSTGGNRKDLRPALNVTTSKWQSSKWNAARVAYFVAHGVFDAELEVCHRCDNSMCIEPRHLFLGTPLDNNRDRHLKGRTVVPRERGEQRYNAKLRDEWIPEIVALRQNGAQYKQIAERYGVSFSTIRNIFNAGNWKHVEVCS